MILQCKCKHESQDKLHGKGQRVFNQKASSPSDKSKTYKCTVCGAEIVRN